MQQINKSLTKLVKKLLKLIGFKFKYFVSIKLKKIFKFNL